MNVYRLVDNRKSKFVGAAIIEASLSATTRHEHRADRSRAKMLQHEQPDCRGKVVRSTAAVDCVDLARQSYAAARGDIFQARPECIFEAYACLMAANDDGSLTTAYSLMHAAELSFTAPL